MDGAQRHMGETSTVRFYSADVKGALADELLQLLHAHPLCVKQNFSSSACKCAGP